MLGKSSVDLSGTEDDTLDLIWLLNALAMLSFWDDPLELGVASEFFNWGSGKRVTEKRLGEEDDKSYLDC